MRIYCNRKINADTEIEPEASALLFEAEDVADLISEITGEDVDVSADEDMVEFAVGEDVYTVEAEGSEEIVESSTRINKTKPVAASRKILRSGTTNKK